MTPPRAMEAFDWVEVDRDGCVRMNGRQVRNTSVSDAGLFQEFAPPRSLCPFCQSPLIHARHEQNGEDAADILDDFDAFEDQAKRSLLWYCRYCRYWQWYRYFYDANTRSDVEVLFGCPPGPEIIACQSKLRAFENDLPDSCSFELAQYLRSKPGAWHSYNPTRFERLVADIFRANYTTSEVVHVGKPDDEGIDVLMVDAEHQQWLVQVKRREQPGRAEGVCTIRNLIGAMVLRGSFKGVVVSTADRFSLRARQAVRKVRHHGMVIKLVDRGILNRMLDPILPDRPWLKVVSETDPALATHFAAQIGTDDQLSLLTPCPQSIGDL